jgi:hypothetical protein
MACGCNGNNDYWVRVLVNPVSQLDRLEADLLKNYQITLKGVSLDLFKKLAHVNFSGYNPASQVVVTAAAIQDIKAEDSEMISALIAKSVKYPLLVLSLTGESNDQLLANAIINQLTEQDLIDYLTNKLD